MYLLDTNVVSERTKPAPDTNVRAWLREHRVGDTYLSVITLAELEQGILRLGDTRRAAALGRFLGTLERQFHGRILSFDRRVARHWSRMTALAIQSGQTLAYADALIAATAQAYELTLVTRNTSDFAATGVPLLNPFEVQP